MERKFKIGDYICKITDSYKTTYRVLQIEKDRYETDGGFLMFYSEESWRLRNELYFVVEKIKKEIGI